MKRLVARNALSATSAALLTIGLSGCRFFPVETNTGYAWKVPKATNTANPDVYPEARFPGLSEKDDFGICFSGGGNRSAVATLGQLRALKETGILDRARYVSAVSGGAWGSASWVFLQDPSPEVEKAFLGPLKMPAQLTEHDLFDSPDPKSFAACASSAEINLVRYARRVGGDESFGKEIGRIFLERHGMDDAAKIPVYGQAEKRRIMSLNSHLKESDFLVCREGRPYYIAGSALSRRDHLVTNPEQLYVPFEFTTSYAGARTYNRRSRDWWPFDIPVGGGYMDNVIYDGLPRHEVDLGNGKFGLSSAKPTPFPFYGATSRLSLPDILGATGSAPTVAAPFLADVLGFPEFQHTAPGNLPGLRTRELLHTDGGAIDNLGLMPLLARGVKNILVFYNTPSPYNPGHMPGEIGHVFGKSKQHGFLAHFDQELARMNHVIDDPKGTLAAEMVASFDKAFAARKTMVHTGTYHIRNNSYHSIKGGNVVNIVWVILGPAGVLKPETAPDPEAAPTLITAPTMQLEETIWFNSLKPELQAKLRENPELKNFPHYKTFLNNGRRIIDLTPLQVNTLAHYTSYAVQINATKIKSFLNISGGTH